MSLFTRVLNKNILVCLMTVGFMLIEILKLFAELFFVGVETNSAVTEASREQM